MADLTNELLRQIRDNGPGGGGGGGPTGSVTAAGTNGTVAQAVQGITGGIPVATSSSPQSGTNERDVTETRTLDASSTSSQQTYTLNGQATLSFAVSGLAASGATLSFFQSNDWNGTTGTFTAVSEVNTGNGVASLTRTSDGQSAIGIEGSRAVRFQITTAGSGTVTLATSISVRSRYTALRSPVLIGQYNATLPTLASGQYGALASDTNGRLILGTSAAQIGTIGNTAFGITGTLPAFAATPTFNVGTTNGLALDATVTARFGTLGQKASAGSAPVVIASDQSAVPVSGTVTANLGTLNGAATAAGQSAVQGSATGGAAATASQLTGGVYNSTPPTLTNGQQAALQFDASGQLKVTGAGGGGGSGVTDSVTNTYTVTATGTQTGVQTAGYGSILVEATGTFSATIQLQGSSNSTNGIDGDWTILNGIAPEDSSSGPGPIIISSSRRRIYHAPEAAWVRINTTTYASGSAIISLVRRVAPTGERSVTVGNSVQVVITNISGIYQQTNTGSGGISTVSRIVSSAASTNATLAKASAGRVYKITGFNAAASIRWLKLHNSSTAPTVGTTPVFFALPLPPGAFSFDAQDIGYYFSAGIAYSLTTGAADADTTALTAGDILNLNVWYA